MRISTWRAGGLHWWTRWSCLRRRHGLLRLIGDRHLSPEEYRLRRWTTGTTWCALMLSGIFTHGVQALSGNVRW